MKPHNSSKHAKQISCIRIILFFLYLSGCCSTEHRNYKYKISMELPTNREIISKPVNLIGDNQFHNLFAKPIYLRTALYDDFIKTVIRPIQLDLFSPDVLEYLLTKKSLNKSLIIHMGDALDLGTTGEFDIFCNVMKHAAQGWVMTPGNHDVYFYGNYHPTKDYASWSDAAKNSGSPMTKDIFIKKYLFALKQQPTFQKGEFLKYFSDTASWENIPENGYIFDKDVVGGRDTLKSLYWKIIKEKPWESFIVQQLDISHPENNTPIGVILIDTTQFAKTPTLVPFDIFGHYNAGLSGSVLSNQIKIIKQWIQKEPQKYWIIAGHSPLDSLTPSAKKEIVALVEKHNILIYLSGHTHQGKFIPHQVKNNVGDMATWLELNIGSIIDWPMEYRKFQVRKDVLQNQLFFDTHRFLVPELAQDVMKNDLVSSSIQTLDFVGSNILDKASPLKTAISIKLAAINTYKLLLEQCLTKLESITGEESHYPIDIDKKKLNPSAKEASIHEQIGEHITQITERVSKQMQQSDSLQDEYDEIENLFIKLVNYDQERWKNINKDSDAYSDYIEFKVRLAIWASRLEDVKNPLPSDQYIFLPNEFINKNP